MSRPSQGGVIKQNIAVLSVSRPNLPLQVSDRVVREHLTDVQTVLLQAVLEVAGLGTPGRVLVRAVPAVVREITDFVAR